MVGAKMRSKCIKIMMTAVAVAGCLWGSSLTADAYVDQDTLDELSTTYDNGVYTFHAESADDFYDLRRLMYDLQDEASASSPARIKVTPGSYDLEFNIDLYDNLELDLTGVTLRYTNISNNMLRFRDFTGEGYSGYRNIKVKGGTFIGNDSITNTMCRLAHGRNITFEDCTFSGGGCSHQMEIAAIDGLYIRNCTFKNAHPISSEKAEAIQLDVPASEYVFKEATLDGTVMKNVEITGCTFSNVKRGIGSHSMIVGYYHNNITINGNTFENVDGECISACNYINSEIADNTITKCGGGILFQTFKRDAKAVYNTIYNGSSPAKGKMIRNAATTIHDNKISLVKNKEADEACGIKVYGFNLKKATHATGKGSSDLIPANDYYAKGVTVKNNTIVSWGHGIHLLDARDCSVTDNKISFKNVDGQKDGIFVEFASKGITLKKNTIKGSKRNGILIQGASSIKKIQKNTITSPKNYGIQIYDKSKVTGAIDDNTITSSKNISISVFKGCTVGTISNNTIKNSGARGIQIFDNSTVKKKITGNKITGAKGYGIFVGSAKNKFTVEKNTVKKTTDKAVHVDSSVAGKVKVK